MRRFDLPQKEGTQFHAPTAGILEQNRFGGANKLTAFPLGKQSMLAKFWDAQK
jgi:hypothetical protein